MSNRPALYRVVTSKAVFGIEVDSDGIIVRAAPYAKARPGQAAQPVLERLRKRWQAHIELVDPPAPADD